MKYTVYKITNNINGKIYKGAHKTSDLNDGYMGSGKILLRAIEKYGVENFTKEILHVFDNSEEMYNKERELVNEQFIKRSDVYNLKLGGSGGFDHVNLNKLNLYGKNGQSGYGLENLFRGTQLKDLLISEGRFEEYRGKLSSAALLFFKAGGKNGFAGKSHTKETKELIGMKSSLRESGQGNSQYGTRWVYNIDLRESKKVPNGYIIENGWEYGLILKWDFLDRKCSKCGIHLHLKKRCNIKQCGDCRSKRVYSNPGRELIEITTEEKYLKLWEEFTLGNFNSIREFSENKNISVPGLTKMWKKHIKEFNKNVERGKSLSSVTARGWTAT